MYLDQHDTWFFGLRFARVYLLVSNKIYKAIDVIEMHVRFHLQVNQYLNSMLGLTWDSYVLSQGKRIEIKIWDEKVHNFEGLNAYVVGLASFDHCF